MMDYKQYSADEALAIEVMARFSGGRGRHGSISKQRKADFIDGALWERERLSAETSRLREALGQISETMFNPTTLKEYEYFYQTAVGLARNALNPTT